MRPFIFLLAPVAALGMTACFGPSCDTAAVDATLQAAEAATPDAQAKVLLTGLDQACTGTPLSEAINAPADERLSAWARDYQKDASGWNAACSGGSQVVMNMANGGNLAETLPEDCTLSRFGIGQPLLEQWALEGPLRITAIGLTQGLDDGRKKKVLQMLKTAPLMP